MRIGIDIDDTLTDINEELENAILEYATRLGKNQAKDTSNLVDKNDGNIYQKIIDISTKEKREKKIEELEKRKRKKANNNFNLLF